MAEHGKVVYPFAAPGALAADWVISVALPNGFMPRHISAVQSNAGAATIKVGTPTDDDAVLAEVAIGQSGVPLAIQPSDLVDVDYQYAKNAVMVITIDFDGAAGTAGQDVAVVVTGLFGA